MRGEPHRTRSSPDAIEYIWVDELCSLISRADLFSLNHPSPSLKRSIIPLKPHRCQPCIFPPFSCSSGQQLPCSQRALLCSSIAKPVHVRQARKNAGLDASIPLPHVVQINPVVAPLVNIAPVARMASMAAATTGILAQALVEYALGQTQDQTQRLPGREPLARPPFRTSRHPHSLLELLPVVLRPLCPLSC